MHTRSGWTLLELVAVMTLLAIVTAGAAFTLRAPLRAGRVQSQIDTVLMADRAARSHARRFGQSARLEFQWAANPTLSVLRGTSGGQNRLLRRIDSLIEVQTPASPQTSDKTAIAIDPAGRSPTYAMCFSVPSGDESWVVVAGETGQPIFNLTERDVDELWELLEESETGP